MHNDLMCLVDRTIDQSVAAAHLCINFSPCAATSKCTGVIKTRCAGFAAASGTLQICIHAVSGFQRSLRCGCKRQMSRFERQSPPLAEDACQEPTDVACNNIYDWLRHTQAEARTCRRAVWRTATSQPLGQKESVLASHSMAKQIATQSFYGFPWPRSSSRGSEVSPGASTNSTEHSHTLLRLARYMYLSITNNLPE